LKAVSAVHGTRRALVGRKRAEGTGFSLPSVSEMKIARAALAAARP